MRSKYYVSRHPDVLAAMEVNTYRYMAFSEAVSAWAKARRAIALYVTTSVGAFVSGMDREPQGRGEWEGSDGVWRPTLDNHSETALLASLEAYWTHVPGLLSYECVRGSHEPSKPFLSADAAWVGYSDIPDDSPSDLWEPTSAYRYLVAKGRLTPPLRFDWEGLV